jgi:hypothetical protein
MEYGEEAGILIGGGCVEGVTFELFKKSKMRTGLENPH